MIPKNQLAVAIRTMSQDLEATKRGAKPTTRLEPFTPTPPEGLPVEPLGLKTQPGPLPAPVSEAPRQIAQSTSSIGGARPNWLPPEPPNKPQAPPGPLYLQAKTPKPTPRPAGPLTDPVRPAFSQIPKPPTPPKPPSPKTVLPSPTAPIPPPVAIPKPPPTKADRGKLIAIILTAVLVLAGGGGVLWWFWLKPSPPTPPVGGPPPPPPPTAPTPLLIGLVSQTVDSASVADIPQSVNRLTGSMQNADRSQVVFVKINGRYATTADIIAGYGLRIPEQIRSNITDLNFLWHKQSEILSSPPSSDNSRFGFIIKLQSLANATANLNAWEQTMPADLDQYLRTSRFMPAAQDRQQWHDSSYRGIQIRYTNFPLADQSLDYAILPDDNLLLVATSRESMYGLIDAALTP